MEFAFKGQYEKCSNSIKCGSILNWLGIEAYPVYDNLPITEDDKKDPFKTQSEFYHKLNSVANDCNFTNKDEIVKFLYLTHNQNTRVREHLLKELTDTTSLADVLHMARVCEHTVHSEEISKQYFESVKTVKQVDAKHQQNNSKPKHKGKGHGGHRSQSQHRSQSRKPCANCSNYGSSYAPRKCKVYGKECYHCHKQGHFSQFCHSK